MDKRSQIKSLLQVVTVPTNLARTSHLEELGQQAPSRVGRVAAQEVAFQIACIKELEKKEDKAKKKIEDGLKLHDPKWVKLIRKYPELLNPTFQKGEPIHGVFHKIETTGTPVKAKRRPIISNPVKAAAGKAAWEQMERDGVIERVSPDVKTEWSSALHIADKAGGGARPCSDFRLLNLQTVPDVHPLPLLRDFTHKIHGAQIFSKIDLRSAFFNIPIWPPHRAKTATLSPWGGTFIYNRLAFGLSSGPSSWQKLLEHVLRGVDNAFIYLDDILVWSEDEKSHEATVEEIFKRLHDNHMAISTEKCVFGKSEVEYLGYRVTKTGITPLPRKLQALREFKTPQTQKDVLHFCGPLTTSGQA